MARALITGASSGIGATYAARLAARGTDLILVARDRQRLDDLADRLRTETGVAVETLVADLSDPAALARVEQRLRDDATITMLVNNAGVAAASPFAGADPDKLETMIRLNVLAVTRLSAAAAPGFVARGEGTLINISSVTALMPESFEPVYLSTKAYVLALGQALHRELGPQGVRVQAVLPGVTRTEIWERAGLDLKAIPAAMVMEVGEMVDAALEGLALGESVTIPALPDPADWETLTQARLRLAPNLSRDRAADRYRPVPRDAA